MKLILKYIRKHLAIFLLSTSFLTVEAIADLLQPTLMSYIVDKGVENADIHRILIYGAIMLGIAAIGACSAVFRNIYASRTSQLIGQELRSDMYHNVMSLSLENIDKLQPSSVITRITNDVSHVRDFINSLMRMMVKAPITCIGAITLIIFQTPKQAPVILGILIVASLLILGNIKIGYPRFGIVQKKLDRLNQISREFISSVRVVKAFNAEKNETEVFDQASLSLAGANTSALHAMAIFAPLINLTVNFGIIIMLWIFHSSNSVQIGKAMASVNYMTQVLFAVSMISNVINVAVRAIASSSRIKEVLDEVPSQEVPEDAPSPQIIGNIEFRDVNFTYYGAGSEALRSISFKASYGETIGIIGSTGSGKTTMVQLVPRMYDATSGSVLIDGYDVTKINLTCLRNAISVVPQKALLFTGTIKENLLWGNNKASDEEIQKMLQVACADSFVQKSKDGIDTLLGQGGVNLSGGQKQRLCIARALLKNPHILILDDCTSALDAQTESQVLKGLKTNVSAMTVLLISQRISTVMRADKILCMEDGTIKGFGTHAELMAECPSYRAIYDSQIGGGSNGR